MSRAVKYLHSCSPPIVHRDLKPENVMLTALDRSTAEAKVLDLGLHMRNRAAHLIGADEGSYYGGTLYDAAQHNGSVYNATLGAARLHCGQACRQARRRRVLTSARNEAAVTLCAFLTAHAKGGCVPAGMSLAEKVKQADAASSDMSISPPRTATRHNSTRAGNILRRIDEERPDALVSGNGTSVPRPDEVRTCCPTHVADIAQRTGGRVSRASLPR